MATSLFSVSPAVLALMAVVLLVRVDGLVIRDSRSSTRAALLNNDGDSESVSHIRKRSLDYDLARKRLWGGGNNIHLGYQLHGLKLIREQGEVGFHSAHTNRRVYNHGDTIIFDHVITNIGNAYNAGKFTCPQSGTYVFNLNILADEHSYIAAAIMQNDTPVFKAISFNRNKNTYNQGGGSAILKLTKGDVIKVKMVEPVGKTETLLGGFSYFSGYLLKAD